MVPNFCKNDIISSFNCDMALPRFRFGAKGGGSYQSSTQGLSQLSFGGSCYILVCESEMLTGGRRAERGDRIEYPTDCPMRMQSLTCPHASDGEILKNEFAICV